MALMGKKSGKNRKKPGKFGEENPKPPFREFFSEGQELFSSPFAQKSCFIPPPGGANPAGILTSVFQHSFVSDGSFVCTYVRTNMLFASSGIPLFNG
jgi:hypothetical protein